MDELAPERARQLIAARWPSLRPLRVDRVAEGGDFDTFLVDDALIFRFAPDVVAGATLMREVPLVLTQLRWAIAPTEPSDQSGYAYISGWMKRASISRLSTRRGPGRLKYAEPSTTCTRPSRTQGRSA